jgi:hypothetical protein
MGSALDGAANAPSEGVTAPLLDGAADSVLAMDLALTMD